METSIFHTKFSHHSPGVNRKVTYDLEGNDIFVLDRQTGILSVTQTLDREARAMYNLTVTAKDHGTPPLSSRTNILVLVSGESLLLLKTPSCSLSQSLFIIISNSGSLAVYRFGRGVNPCFHYSNFLSLIQPSLERLMLKKCLESKFYSFHHTKHQNCCT